MSRAKFHRNNRTTVQDVQDYKSLIFWHTVQFVDVTVYILWQ